MADRIGEVVIEVGADARDFRGDAERGIEKSLKKIGKRIERAAEKWARDMRDSVKDALEGLVLQVNARIDPKDLRRIEAAIARTKASPEVTLSRADLEEIKQKLRRAEWRTPVKPTLDDNAVARLGRELDEMRASVKARVDIDEKSRRRALNAIKSTEVAIDAKVEIDGHDIAEIRERIANIKSALKVTASLEKSSQREIKSELERIDARLSTDASLSEKSIKRIQRQLNNLGAEVETHAHLSEASKKKIKHEINKLDGKATVNADLDDGKARFDLKRLTAKPRFVDIHARLAKASVAQVAAQLKALAGGNIFSNLKTSIIDLFTNLDTFAVKAAGAGTAILGLTSVVGAGLGTVAQFGISLVHTLPAMLAMPGVMAAAAAGVGIFAAAMSDASTVLEDLGPSFSALQDSISNSFWGEAEASVRSLITNGLEALTPAISTVASNMGTMAAAVASVAQDHIPGFQASLGYLATAMDIGGDGAGAFTDALLSLGEVGAKYLPSIAGWANNVAYSFQAWVQAKTASGEMDEAIQAAAKTFGTLKDIVFDLGGILGGVFQAMASGSAPIDSIASALDSANKAVNGPLWQGTLSTIFSSMGEAASHAFAGVGSLGQAFTSLAPTLSVILPLVGQIIETGLKGISSALQDPAFQGGLTQFFQGVLTAVQALAPAMPALGQAFGAIASVAGQLLAVIAPLIAQLVEQLAPVFTQLATLLAPIIQQLGAALMPIIQALGPLLSELFAVLGPLINDLLAAIVPAIQPIVQAIVALLIPAFQLIGTVVKDLMPLVIPIITLIKDTIVSAMRVIQGIINIVLGIISGNWSQVWEGIKQVGSGVWNFIKTTFATFGQALKAIAQVAWNLLGGIISGGWNLIKSGTVAAWNGLKSAVSAGVSSVVSFVTSLPGKIKGLFSSAGSWLLSAGKNVIQGFISGITSMFTVVKNKLAGLTNLLPSWKGPAPVDKVLLTPAGELIMQGLIKGLESQYGAVRSSLQGLTEDLTKPATIGLNANVQPLPARASSGSPNPAPDGAPSFDKGRPSGATINITNNYPQAKPDSKTRDEVAEGLRLAAIL